jgi:SAM-dependent methyltransferase
MVHSVTYVKRSSRNLAEQNDYMWQAATYESVYQTVLNRSIRPAFDKYLRPGNWVLEAGCGNGAWVRYFQERGCHAVGIDNNWHILAQGRSHGLALVESDVLHKCFAAGAFDACVSLGVVEHFVPGPQAPLQELKRVLKPGGLLFVSTPCNNWLRKLVNHPLRDAVNMMDRLRQRPLHFVEYRFERHELVEHVRAQGFEILETVPNDYRLDQNERSIGFYTDWPFFRDRRDKWRLNGPGRLAFRALKGLSPYLVVSGILVVARKPASQPGLAAGVGAGKAAR